MQFIGRADLSCVEAEVLALQDTYEVMLASSSLPVDMCQICESLFGTNDDYD